VSPSPTEEAITKLDALVMPAGTHRATVLALRGEKVTQQLDRNRPSTTGRTDRRVFSRHPRNAQ
jgi:hypothetical protein